MIPDIDAVLLDEVAPPHVIEKDIPYVTHAGNIDLEGLSISVHQLSNGLRIIPIDDMKRAAAWLDIDFEVFVTQVHG